MDRVPVNPRFRAATSADIDAVVRLVESAYRGDASRTGWTTEADFLDGRRTGSDEIGACIARARSRILVAVLRQAQDERELKTADGEPVEKKPLMVSLSNHHGEPVEKKPLMVSLSNQHAEPVEKKPLMVSLSNQHGEPIEKKPLMVSLSNHHGEPVEPRTQDERDQLLACAHVAEENGAGYFGMFSVQPGLQNAGIGKALLAEAERIVREEWRLPAMRMTVIDIRAELIAWYERRGYRRTGILKPFPYGDVRFGIPKRDDLRFEVLEKFLG